VILEFFVFKKKFHSSHFNNSSYLISTPTDGRPKSAKVLIMPWLISGTG
jgi:hypothetical protein